MTAVTTSGKGWTSLASATALAIIVSLGFCKSLPVLAGDPAVVATEGSSARVALIIPKDARKSGQVMLDLAIQSLFISGSHSVGGIVWLAFPDGRKRIEVGRFSFFPAEPFEAADKAEQRVYRFNITDALRTLDSKGQEAVVQVELIDRLHQQPIPGAKIVLGDAKIVVR